MERRDALGQSIVVPVSYSTVPPASTSRRLTFGLLFLLLCYVTGWLAVGASMELRTGLLRYWSILGAASLAAAVPHVLLPDPHVALLQRLNSAPDQLLAHQLRQWGPVVALFALPCLVLAYVDPAQMGDDLVAKTAHGAQALLVISGTALYGFERYVTIGQTSQAWQEGRAGGWYHSVKDKGGTIFAVPDGLVPTLLATTKIFTVAITVIIVGAYLGGVAPGLMWIPGALLTAWGALRLHRSRAIYDQHFYTTNALYREVMAGGRVQTSDREPITYDAIYWTPHRWRPATWASLRQFDRVLPMGRLVALGHGLFWVLVAQDVSTAVLSTYLAFFIAAQNGACYVLTRSSVSPPAFQVALRAPLDWAFVRFFTNLRWTMPFLLSLLLVAFFADSFTYAEALLWTGLDVVGALGAAALVTLATEGQIRRQYA